MLTLAVLTLALAIPLMGPAGAASYPDRPIKLIVPFAPGGPPDVAARIIGDWLSSHLGPVVVENHIGAGGTLAARLVAGAPPDGYTLMAATSGVLAISPQLYKNAGIDPLKDFTAVALLSSTPQVLAVNAALPVHSVKELVAYAKANAGKLNYGAVIGTPPHLSGEMFKHLTGTDIVFVPYKGASQATTDVLTGQMNMTFEGATGIMPYLKSGKLRALAVTSPHRLPEIPDVPTMIEAGYPGMPPDAWQAIVAPAGTSADVVARNQRHREPGFGRSASAQPHHRPRRRSAADVAQRFRALHRRTSQTLGRHYPCHRRKTGVGKTCCSAIRAALR